MNKYKVTTAWIAEFSVEIEAENAEEAAAKFYEQDHPEPKLEEMVEILDNSVMLINLIED